MRLKVVVLGEGLHPSEVVVGVKTKEGTEQLVIDRSVIEDNFMDIGYPIKSESSNYLVELPQESMRGSWRIWVPQDTVESSPA